MSDTSNVRPANSPTATEPSKPAPALSRRQWLRGFARKAAGVVAEQVQDRLPDLPVPPEPEPPTPVAWILTEHCFAFRGPECGACARLCPPGVDALKMVRWKPQIDPTACTGCGECLKACPTIPKAIELRVDEAAADDS